MSGRIQIFSGNKLLILSCLLLTIDILVRWVDPSPVEATRISGRETDAAFQSLSAANYTLAQSNQVLAASLERLSAELRAMGLEKWIKSEEQVAKSQEALAKSSESFANALKIATDALIASNRGASESEAVGEQPEVIQGAEPAEK